MSDSATAQCATCRLCGARGGTLRFELREKPPGETEFGIDAQRYFRRIYQCDRCGVYFNVHELLEAGFYTGSYNEAVYRRNLADKFHEIMSLPPERSDNKQRVGRIVRFCGLKGLEFDRTRVLDVGSGLCVFLGEMAKHGFRCFCVDPDPVAVRHAITVAGVEEAHAGTLDDFAPHEPFDLITFNKVLEHVPDPVRQLGRALEFLKPDGSIYIELPDGDGALRRGSVFEREEFFVEHITVFNRRSFQYLIEAAGLRCLDLDAIHDPSGKCTVFAFCCR